MCRSHCESRQTAREPCVRFCILSMLLSSTYVTTIKHFKAQPHCTSSCLQWWQEWCLLIAVDTAPPWLITKSGLVRERQMFCKDMKAHPHPFSCVSKTTANTQSKRQTARRQRHRGKLRSKPQTKGHCIHLKAATCQWACYVQQWFLLCKRNTNVWSVKNTQPLLFNC